MHAWKTSWDSTVPLAIQNIICSEANCGSQKHCNSTHPSKKAGEMTSAVRNAELRRCGMNTYSTSEHNQNWGKPTIFWQISPQVQLSSSLKSVTHLSANAFPGKRSAYKGLNPWNPQLITIHSNKESQPPFSWSQTATSQKPSFQINVKLLGKLAYKKERLLLSCFKSYPLSSCVACLGTLHYFACPWAVRDEGSFWTWWAVIRNNLGLYPDRMQCLTVCLLISPHCKGIFLAHMHSGSSFCLLGEVGRQTPGKPFSMSGWEFSFQSYSRALNKGLWWATPSFHPQQWIKVLLWTGKLLEIAIMTQPSSEDWTFHAQTSTTLEKNL